MLEKPALKDERIITCLEKKYGVRVQEIAFLPLGADQNTAVYRVVADDGIAYFVKLRGGDFDKASVAVPKYLSELGVAQIIPPLPALAGRLWANLNPYHLVLYPFVDGRNGFERNLSDHHRIELGTALKKLHMADVPAPFTANVRRERFSSRWRVSVKSFLQQIEQASFDDPIAANLAAFLQTKHAAILALIQRTEQLALELQSQTPDFVLCHADMHGWNLLIDAQNNLFLIDWDTLMFAPKERDLMFVGCGLGGNGHTLQEEETLFYQGYGQTKINPVALAYYRYERIIEDIAVSCEQLFLSDEGGEDRARSLETVKSNFRPNGTIEMAFKLDQTQIKQKARK